MKPNKITRIIIFPALMGATSWFIIPIPGAPITLQLLFVFCAGLLLSAREAVFAMIIYLLLGVIGMPVFAGLQSGFGTIFGPTGGFLLVFPLIAFIIAAFKKHLNVYILLSVTIIIVYVVGVIWLSYSLKLDIIVGLTSMLVYIPGDIIKMVTAVIICKSIEQMHLFKHGNSH